MCAGGTETKPKKGERQQQVRVGKEKKKINAEQKKAKKKKWISLNWKRGTGEKTDTKQKVNIERNSGVTRGGRNSGGGKIRVEHRWGGERRRREPEKEVKKKVKFGRKRNS